MNIEIVNQVVGFATVVGHVVLVPLAGYLWWTRKQVTNQLRNFLVERGVLFSFLIALFSMAMSLFYSEYAGFPPCSLCWYQRIFMYSQAFILGLAVFKRDKKITDYTLLLSGIGAIIALYHVYISYGGSPLIPCGLSGGVACNQRFVFEFGYVTIQVMAFTGFLYIAFFSAIVKFFKKSI